MALGDAAGAGRPLHVPERLSAGAYARISMNRDTSRPSSVPPRQLPWRSSAPHLRTVGDAGGGGVLDLGLLPDELMREVVRGHPEAAFVVSDQDGGTLVHANARAAELFGLPADLLPGLVADRFATPYDRNGEPVDPADSPLGIALRQRIPARASLRYADAQDRALWLDITCRPLDTTVDGHNLVVCYADDITAAKGAERAAAAANRELSAQLADITRLHELTEALGTRGTVEELLTEVLRAGGLLTDARIGVARLYDPATGTLPLAATIGLDDAARTALADWGDTLNHGDTLYGADGSAVIEDIETDPRCTPQFREIARAIGFRSVYCVRLPTADGGWLGNLTWAFPDLNRPTRRQRRLTSTYCRFAGQLLETNQLHEQQRRIATTLQRSLLLEEIPAIPGLDIAARFFPGASGMDTGGDWYDVIPLPDGQVGIAIGDVMGKGVQAATVMGQLRTALRSFALLYGDRPTEVLRHLNALTLNMGLTDMATVVYLVLDPRHGRARLANAGHCPPLLVDRSGPRYLDGGHHVPIGVVPDWSAPEGEFALDPGAFLLLYTDGLVERRGVSIQAGLDRLLTLAVAAPADLDHACNHLVDACLPDGNAQDDVALLTVKRAF
ncbi:SpoIIE family protein phosphatase [Yinghuangia soli]|uniref:SpoIIE family protein phosphatase n=1 Tax=Yinghuangia soli TaxID=2908204 RepID=A0AA41U0C2_9ACTN|nr:SpoIIE family protein phosphatase [Yinghuangia soli]MCF2528255.1 SpoIIE family protein phosphatase [Yinghuangia soli]